MVRPRMGLVLMLSCAFRSLSKGMPRACSGSQLHLSWELSVWDDLSALEKINSLAGDTGRWLYPVVQSREPGWSS